jgi:hypothetical protein
VSDIMSRAYRQAGRIREQRSELSRVTGEIDSYLNQLGNGWKAPEIQYVHDAFSKVKKDVEKALSILNSADDVLIRTARMIDDERKQALEAAKKVAAEKATSKK